MSKNKNFLLLIIPLLIFLAPFLAASQETNLNSFYFLKDWKWEIKKLLTFNPVKKIGLELDIINEKAGEIKELEKIAPRNIEAIAKTLNKYEKHLTQLINKLENLKQTSEDPKVDQLTDKIMDKAVNHQQLFDELKEKFKDRPELKESFNSISERLIEAIKVVFEKIDSSKKFKERIENIARKQTGELKELRMAELIDRLEEEFIFPEKLKEILNLKEDLLLKFGARLERLFPLDSLISLIKELPGDQLRRLKLLDEVREQVINPDIKSELNISRQKLLEKSIERGLINEEAAKAEIESVSKLIEEIDVLIAEREGDVGVSIGQLLERAKFNRDSAKQALETGNPGNAFGQATAANAAAKNTFKQLRMTNEDVQNILNVLKTRYDELNSKIAARRLKEWEDLGKQILNLEQLINQKVKFDRIASLIQRIKFSLSTLEYYLLEEKSL